MIQKNIDQMSIEEMHKELMELEEAFVDVLSDNESPELLRLLWTRIRHLQSELAKRK